MDTARVVPFTEARAHLTELLDQVEAQHEHLVITRKGRPAVVVLSAEEYEALEETLTVLEDEETMEALRRSDEDVAAGRVYAWDKVKRDLELD